MMKHHLTLFVLLILMGCQPAPKVNKNTQAHPATITANKQVSNSLPLEHQQDFIDAKRGLIASAPLTPIKNSQGEIIWNNQDYAFVTGQAPATVNPSLWRQATLNNIRGLFKVTDKIYQLRGFDFSNMTIIESDNGWIIIDPLTAKETAKYALEFAQQHLGKHPIKAIILSHAHMDHFGGVLAIMDSPQAKESPVDIIAPSGFLEAATSENIIAGIAMARRSTYMYGKALPRSGTGHVGSGLGTGPAYGSFGIITPTISITKDMEELNIDGIDFVFQNASGTESIAEITFYLPQLNAFGGAELVSRNMHNLYTLRGAQVRDALAWSAKIDQAKRHFNQANIYFGSHHWPIWGQENVQTFLADQRDMYKYLHDQTVRLINNGFNADEIAQQVKLPQALASKFYNRGYYGSTRHNVKAIYQFYMGWFDANPANLNPLPHSESADRYIKLAGGPDAMLAAANQAYNDGEFRWAAQLLNHLVFSQQVNEHSKKLLAQTYQQLGYQAESAPWRNFYLKGAQELLEGVSNQGVELVQMRDILINTDVSKFFVSMAVRLNSEKAQGVSQVINIEFTDINESYDLVLKNSVLHAYKQSELITAAHEVNTYLKITKDMFVDMLIGQAGIKETLLSDELSIEGSTLDLISFLRLFDQPDNNFNIVTP